MSTGAFMDWLRVELLRLRSLDWGSGSKAIHWLKDGVGKFSSSYPLNSLAKNLGLSVDDILALVDSPSVLNELEGKSFTASWTGDAIRLSWLEEGILEWATDLSQNYVEKDGKFFVTSRFVQRAIYLDGTERIVSDSGEMGPAEVSKEEFIAAAERLLEDEPDHEFGKVIDKMRGTLFVTYENTSNPHVTIHLSRCSQIRKRGGEDKHGRGTYKDHETLEQARSYADTTGLPVRECSYCKPAGDPRDE
jgi:hypothetical protein